MKRTTILIVNGEKIATDLSMDRLSEERYSIVEVNIGEEAVARVREDKIDLAIVDFGFHEMRGIETLREIKKVNPDLPVITTTISPTVEIAVRVMKDGACDYLTRPLDTQELEHRIKEAVENRKIAAPLQRVEKHSFENMVGKSTAMQRIFRLISDIAHSDATVLIQGESGTGKEVVARAIHQKSTRANRSFITANCAAIAETLLESELFGYEKGAFTGAIISRKGRFELAEGGTLLLDEVTEMKLSAQVDLLRVLQEKEFRRVGGSRLIKSDVRIIASSNKNVEEQVEHGNFREDLYYRLNVIPLHVPPLRNRKEDIPFLIDHFLNKHRIEAKRKIMGISEEAVQLLTSHDWPGNVRELENVVLRAIVLGKKESILSEDLPEKIRRLGGSCNEVCYPLSSSLEDVEKSYISGVLRATGWNLSKSARILKINRMTLYNKIRKYGFRRSSLGQLPKT